MADDDDDFEDLFSFGGATTTNGNPTTISSDADDIFGDLTSPSLGGAGASSTGVGGGGEGNAGSSGGSGGSGTTMSEFDILNDDDIFGSPMPVDSAVASSTTTTPTTATTSAGATQASKAAADEFDDIFGTPPVTPLESTPKPPGVSLSSSSSSGAAPLENLGRMPLVPGSKSDDNAAGATGSAEDIDNFLDDVNVDDENTNNTDNTNNTNNANSEVRADGSIMEEEDEDNLLAATSNIIDDFHPHDADTRDFLDWLDDDDAAKKKEEANDNSAAVGSSTQGGGGASGVDAGSGGGSNDFSVDVSLDISGSNLLDTTGAISGAGEANQQLKTSGEGTSTSATTSSASTSKQEIKSNTNVDATVDEDDDDDFDFDQMIAEADAKSEQTQPITTQPQQVLTGDAIATALGATRATSSTSNIAQTNISSKADMMDISSLLADGGGDTIPAPNNASSSSANSIGKDSSSGMVTPEPLSKPYKSACIEEELSFDQWGDDNEQDATATATAAAAKTEVMQGGEYGAIEGTTSSASKDTQTVSEEGSGTNILAKAMPLKPTFASLSEAIRSNASTTEDIRTLFAKAKGRATGSSAPTYSTINENHDLGVPEEDRSHLWTKLISGKVLEDLENGSLADSFREWCKKEGEVIAANISEDDKYAVGGENDAMINSLLTQTRGIDATDASFEEKKKDLLLLLRFNDRNKQHAKPKSNDKSNKGTIQNSNEIDPLIPPVANAILATGISPATASVVLSNIEPSAMPLLRLSPQERAIAAKALHSDFYLLACYHLPLLVMHLDRHCPGWYWPRKKSKENIEKSDGEEGDSQPVDDAVAEGKEKAEDDHDAGESKPEQSAEKKFNRELENNGLVPLSWFVTNFAGECGENCLEHRHLLPLWDNLLTIGDCSWKYFLAVAILDKKSDNLLLARGEELNEELVKALNFMESSLDEEDFVGGVSAGEGDGNDMVSEWLSLAKSLMDCTPSSVIERLRTADDRAVTDAITAYQAEANEKLQAQLEKEAKEHEAALKREREERDAEAKKAMIRARLAAYYRTHNPEKIDTLDKIMKMFDGRFDVLNEKLKKKYGEGFLPDEQILHEHVTKQTRSFLMSVNQSMSETKKHVATTLAERRKRHAKQVSTKSYTPVALEVSPTEVIPLICSTKGHHEKFHLSTPSPGSEGALKWYLVDCRPQSIQKEQGRFPTAVELSPEKLQDPDAIQQLTDMFESLRGAVHICIMGEGFASFPALYDVKGGEQKLLDDDFMRTSSCALFFLKRGFPFVSVLKGGFAAAHAFLWRKGPPMGLAPVEVMVDYDPEVSMFAQLEIAREEQEEYKNAPAREKTVKTLQKVIDHSMTRLTLEEQRLNDLASDLSRPETRDKMKQSVSKFFTRSHQSTSAAPKESSLGFGRTPPLFMQKQLSGSTEDEATKKKLVPNQDEEVASALSKFTEKLSLKLSSVDTAASAEATGGDGAEATVTTEQTDEEHKTESAVSGTPEGKEKATEHQLNQPKPEAGVFQQLTHKLKASNATKNTATEGSKPIEGPSKVSSAFSSFAIRLQQKNTPAPSVPNKSVSEGTTSPEATIEKKTGDVPQEQTVTSSFSLFAQRIAAAKNRDAAKPATTTVEENVIEASKTDAMDPATAVGESDVSDSISSVNLDDSVTTGTTDEETIDLQAPQTQEEDNADEPATEAAASKTSSAPAAKSLFSSFASKIAETKAAEGTQDATQVKAEPKKNPFAGFSLRKAANQPTVEAAAKSTEETNATKLANTNAETPESTLKESSETASMKSFAGFTRAFGSSNQSQPARNPFASLIKPKAEDATATKEPPKEAEAPTIASKFSLGMKYLSEQDDPFQPKSFGFGRTRFSSPSAPKPSPTAETKPDDLDLFVSTGDEDEEAILFDVEDDDDHEVIDLMGDGSKSSSEETPLESIETTPQEDQPKTANLFAGLGPQPQGADPLKELFGDDPFGIEDNADTEAS